MVGVDVGRCFFPFFPFVGFIVCSETVVGTDVGACFFLFDFLVGFTVASVEGAIVGIDEGCDEAVTATDGATVGITAQSSSARSCYRMVHVGNRLW